MAAGEGGEHQFAGVGLTVSYGHLGAALVHLFDLVDVGEVQLGIYALSEHIHGQSDDIHVAGALAVAEEGGLYTVGAGQQTHLSCGHAAASVVVGMEGDDGAVTAGQLLAEVLQHIGKLVGHTVLHRGGEVKNDLVLGGGVEVLQHSLADLHGVVHLGAHEGLGGVFEAQVRAGLNDRTAHFVNEVGGIGSDFGDALGVHVEDHLALEGGSGVVEVEDDVFGTADGIKSFFDQMLTGLNQHLDGDIVGDMAALDQFAADLVLGLAGGGEADLDLLDTDVHKGVEIIQLFLQIHRVNQCLVAVAQVYRAPGRGLGDDIVRPGAADDLLGLEGDVLLVSGFHGESPPLRCPPVGAA